MHCRTFLLLFPNPVFTKGQSCQKEDQGEVWHTGFTNGAETAFSFLFFLLWPYLTLHSPQPIKFLWKLVSNINKWTSARARPPWPLKRQLYEHRAGRTHVPSQLGNTGNTTSMGCASLFPGRDMTLHQPSSVAWAHPSQVQSHTAVSSFPRKLSSQSGLLFLFLSKAVE